MSYSRGVGFPENGPSSSVGWFAVNMVSPPTYTNGHLPVVESFGSVFSIPCIEIRGDVPKWGTFQSGRAPRRGPAVFVCRWSLAALATVRYIAGDRHENEPTTSRFTGNVARPQFGLNNSRANRGWVRFGRLSPETSEETPRKHRPEVPEGDENLTYSPGSTGSTRLAFWGRSCYHIMLVDATVSEQTSFSKKAGQHGTFVG